MGNLCCCFKSHSYYDDDDDETRRILDNPVGINNGHDEHHDIHNVHVDHITSGFYGSIQTNGIVQQTKQERDRNEHYQTVLERLSSRVIDISLYEKSLEQVDLTDREQQLHERLSRVYKPVRINSNQPFIVTFDQDFTLKPNDPISLSDYKLITYFANKCSTTVNHGFAIFANESFVANFDS